ncbi:MAG: lipoate protein ligase C-terminal domain-containing protein, partial [Oscillospiraceae bacterium]
YLPQGVTLKQFQSRLLEMMFPSQTLPRHELTPEELSEIERLRSERYLRWDWNYGVSPPYHIHKKRRFEGVGSIEASMDIEKGRITGLAFSGDYFGVEDSGRLAAQLVGCLADANALSEMLSTVPVDSYFSRLETAELVRLLAE